MTTLGQELQASGAAGKSRRVAVTIIVALIVRLVRRHEGVEPDGQLIGNMVEMAVCDGTRCVMGVPDPRLRALPLGPGWVEVAMN